MPWIGHFFLGMPLGCAVVVSCFAAKDGTFGFLHVFALLVGVSLFIISVSV